MQTMQACVASWSQQHLCDVHLQGGVGDHDRRCVCQTVSCQVITRVPVHSQIVIDVSCNTMTKGMHCAVSAMRSMLLDLKPVLTRAQSPQTQAAA
jgi:hypothetical protein